MSAKSSFKKVFNLILFFSFINLLGFYNIGYSWHRTGHMLVANIAYKNLDKDVAQRLDKLAVLGAEYYPLSNEFISASVWADDIKDSGMLFFNTWHYKDEYYSIDNTPLPNPNLYSGVAYYALDKNLKILTSPKSNEIEKAFAFRFIIHIVGDLHQPLHSVSRVSQEHPQGDRGGNLFKIKHKFKHLHGLWDSGMSKLPDFPRPLDNESKKWFNDFSESLMTEYPMSSYSTDKFTGKFTSWQDENLTISKDHVYANIKQKSAPSEKYLDDNFKVVKQQLALGGYRLANILNCAYDSPRCIG